MHARTLTGCLATVMCCLVNAAFAQVPPATTAPSASSTSAPPAPQAQVYRLQPLVVKAGSVSPTKIELSPHRESNPASVSVVTPPPEVRETNQTYGDFVRPITGVIVNDFGQGGVGYGVTIRGFDTTEHGRDVASFVDGVPANQPSSLQVNGYTDLNTLMPDLTNRVAVTRGPFDVRAGNFAIGGSVNYETAIRPKSGVTLSGGEFGNVHGAGIYARDFGAANGYASLLVDDTQGYRHNASLMRINTL